MEPQEIFRALADEQVEYVLIGGLAATIHGASLVTLDTDVCIRHSPSNCERMARALERLEAEIYPTRQVPIPITADLLQTHRLVHLRTKAGRLDLITSVPGLGTFEEFAHGSTTIQLDDVTIPVLTLDQLIQAKSAMNQAKDREHLDQLLAIREMKQSPPGNGG